MARREAAEAAEEAGREFDAQLRVAQERTADAERRLSEAAQARRLLHLHLHLHLSPLHLRFLHLLTHPPPSSDSSTSSTTSSISSTSSPFSFSATAEPSSCGAGA